MSTHEWVVWLIAASGIFLGGLGCLVAAIGDVIGRLRPQQFVHHWDDEEEEEEATP